MSILEKVALGYPPTILLSSICLWVAKACEIDLIIYILPITGLMIIGSKINNNTIKGLFSKGPSNSTTFGIVFIYLLAAVTLYATFTLTTSEPTTEYSTNVYEDTLWTIGNTWSLIRNGLPLQDFRFSEINLGYHIGQNLYYAYGSKLTGLSPVFLHLKIAPFFDLYFLVIAIIACAKIFLGASSKSSWFIAIPVLFSVVEITSFKIGGAAEYHEIYTNPISLAFGLSSFLIMISILSRRYFWGKPKDEVPIGYVLILFAVSVSTKGIISVLVLGAISIIIAARMIIFRLKPKLLDYNIILSMISIVILYKFTIFSGSSGWIVAPQIETSPVAIKLADQLGINNIVEQSYFLIGPISRSIRFLFHTLIWNWISVFVIISLLILIKYDRSGLKDYCFLQFSIVFILVCSSLYGLNIMENYWANVYYYKYTVSLLAMQLGIISCQYIDRLNNARFHMHYDKFYLLVIGLLTTFVPSLVDARAKILHANTDEWKIDRLMKPTWRPTAFLTKDEYEGLIWMRNNLKSTSVVASDRKDKIGHSGDYTLSVWFAYSAYSGLQFYNEGEAYNKYNIKSVAAQRWNNVKALLDAKNQNEINKAWQQLEADYMLITKRLTINHTRKLGKIAYENSGIMLVKNPFK